MRQSIKGDRVYFLYYLQNNAEDVLWVCGGQCYGILLVVVCTGSGLKAVECRIQNKIRKICGDGLSECGGGKEEVVKA